MEDYTARVAALLRTRSRRIARRDFARALALALVPASMAESVAAESEQQQAGDTALNLFLGTKAGSATRAHQTLRGVRGYGNRNTGIGSASLERNVRGQNNTAVGALALHHNHGEFDAGNDNTAVGHKALWANAPQQVAEGGINNVAVGAEALMLNTIGRNNVAVGCDALHENTRGESNTAVGHSALLNSTTTYNTAVGSLALRAQTTGERNTATGVNALLLCSSGRFNSAFGMGALNGVTSADNNCATGYFAGYENTRGDENTYVGAEAGRSDDARNSNATGSRNVYLGFQSGPATANQISQAIGIGYRAKPRASNSALIGGIGKDAVTLGVGTDVVAGAAPGDDVRPRGAKYRTVDASGAGTTALIGGDRNGLTSISSEAVQIQANGAAVICSNQHAGMLFVVDETSFASAQFALLGQRNGVREVSDVEKRFSAEKSTANMVNVYPENGSYMIQNTLGTRRTFRLVLIGA